MDKISALHEIELREAVSIDPMQAIARSAIADREAVFLECEKLAVENNMLKGLNDHLCKTLLECAKMAESLLELISRKN